MQAALSKGGHLQNLTVEHPKNLHKNYDEIREKLLEKSSRTLVQSPPGVSFLTKRRVRALLQWQGGRQTPEVPLLWEVLGVRIQAVMHVEDAASKASSGLEGSGFRGLGFRVYPLAPK